MFISNLQAVIACNKLQMLNYKKKSKWKSLSRNGYSLSDTLFSIGKYCLKKKKKKKKEKILTIIFIAKSCFL